MNTQFLIIISNLISGCVVALVVWLLTRKKSKAEILFNSTNAYSTMLHDLKLQIDIQAEQIKGLEAKLQFYTDMITNYQKRETELLSQIHILENENKNLKAKIQNDKHSKANI